MSLDLQSITAFLCYEARQLDDRQWDEWLSCYSPNVEYWMPCWGDDDRQTDDPQTQMSLMYYPSRGGLEDRVYRIKTERSSASTPEPRTTHMIGNVEMLSGDGQRAEVRYNWVTYSHRYHSTDMYFGTTHCTLEMRDGRPGIVKKKIRLNNDYINQVIDIYHV
ncbi:benzoate 1,2-dioxygenase small subunit [Enterobacillus tribolii]|uniref:Benzoate/toluate 1,2-dioxygenase beta subunit n=1 Tax=Enterobacillus tribolii TaxID=1487935 RepID=A0A370Q7W6_9GAMM|nr:benzoate 1,2-dioxygenase small subunit [Enterobacillus tribolii]MBW7984938.1 benzoate 1,2-dioxygenase small subunit [Enterobacillus tribolii]RDK84150.1 benzoate/toluate 1,2-dioxygenase beta subunit [Enterobacillus tribolii]